MNAPLFHALPCRACKHHPPTAVALCQCPRPEPCGSDVLALSGICIRCGTKHYRPQPGPQTEFLRCRATVAIMGGAAGGGKTFSLLLDWLRHSNTPGAVGLLVRRFETDIELLWPAAVALFAGPGVRIRSSKGSRDITWPSGARLYFRRLDAVDFERYKGPEFAWVGIEEADQCSIDSIIYMISRLRTTTGIRPVLRMTCNPNPDHTLASFVDPYYLINDGGPCDGEANRAMSGVIRWFARTDKGSFVFGDTQAQAADLAGVGVEMAISFAFIPALTTDNVFIGSDYLARLSIQGPVRGLQLMRGNWRVRTDFRGMLRYGWWGQVEAPLAPILRRVRAWDPAARRPHKDYPDPDYSAGARVEWDVHDRWYVTDMVAAREEVPEIHKLMAETAEADGPTVTQVLEQEPAAAGVSDINTKMEVLRSSGKCGPIVVVKASKNKIVKLGPVSKQLRCGMKGNVPRLIELDPEAEPEAVHQPRGFVIVSKRDMAGNVIGIPSWLDRAYEDASNNHHPTVGALWWWMIRGFFGMVPHDDLPDAVGIAHSAPRNMVAVPNISPIRRARVRS